MSTFLNGYNKTVINYNIQFVTESLIVVQCKSSKIMSLYIVSKMNQIAVFEIKSFISI